MIIFCDKNNKNKIISYGFASEKISIIPPGITGYDLELPNNGEVKKLREDLKLEENDFIILYLGSPLSLRGVDTLINGISIVHKDIPSIRLIILSRRRSHELLKEDKYIKNLCIKRKINNRTKIISAFLSRNEIKN